MFTNIFFFRFGSAANQGWYLWRSAPWYWCTSWHDTYHRTQCDWAWKPRLRCHRTIQLCCANRTWKDPKSYRGLGKGCHVMGHYDRTRQDTEQQGWTFLLTRQWKKLLNVKQHTDAPWLNLPWQEWHNFACLEVCHLGPCPLGTRSPDLVHRIRVPAHKEWRCWWSWLCSAVTPSWPWSVTQKHNCTELSLEGFHTRTNNVHAWRSFQKRQTTYIFFRPRTYSSSTNRLHPKVEASNTQQSLQTGIRSFQCLNFCVPDFKTEPQNGHHLNLNLWNSGLCWKRHWILHSHFLVIPLKRDDMKIIIKNRKSVKDVRAEERVEVVRVVVSRRRAVLSPVRVVAEPHVVVVLTQGTWAKTASHHGAPLDTIAGRLFWTRQARSPWSNESKFCLQCIWRKLFGLPLMRNKTVTKINKRAIVVRGGGRCVVVSPIVLRLVLASRRCYLLWISQPVLSCQKQMFNSQTIKNVCVCGRQKDEAWCSNTDLPSTFDLSKLCPVEHIPCGFIARFSWVHHHRNQGKLVSWKVLGFVDQFSFVYMWHRSSNTKVADTWDVHAHATHRHARTHARTHKAPTVELYPTEPDPEGNFLAAFCSRLLSCCPFCIKYLQENIWVPFIHTKWHQFNLCMFTNSSKDESLRKR